MAGVWYVITSQTETRILEEGDPLIGPIGSKKFKIIKTLKNPLGRERNRALLRHKPGVKIKSQGHAGSSRSTSTGGRDPHEDAARAFSKKIAAFLEKRRTEKKFRKLAIFAEPHFLGKLKSSLTPQTKELVVDWVHSDMGKASAGELTTYLNSIKRKAKSTNRTLD